MKKPRIMCIIRMMVARLGELDHAITHCDHLSRRRKQLDLGVTVRSLLLTTIPDSTSQKFLLLGTSPRGKGGDEGRHAMIFLDFAPLRHRQCTDKDFERWYARSSEGQECLMGHKVCESCTLVCECGMCTDTETSNGIVEEDWTPSVMSVTNSRTQ